MATRQQLENRLAQLDAELQALRNSLGGRSNAELDPETENRFLAERTRIRNQRSEIQRQLDRILVSDARSFYAEVDLGTGLVQIRTSDGLFAGRGNTLEEAKAAAIRNGANASALTNLVDPRAKAEATQGAGTVSTGDTTAAAAAARDNRATTQAPPVPAESASATGEVTTTAATTLPSNAAPGQSPTPTTTAAPGKLPEGQVSATPGTAAQVPGAQGSQGAVAARQIGGANLDTPDENTNQVSYIYFAYQVTSNFRQGRFTQELQGAQIFFPLAPQQQENTNAFRAGPDQSAAETARLSRQAGAVPQGTVVQSVATPGVLSGELAAFVGTGETNQEVNTRARGLAQVLDQRAGIGSAPLAASSTAAEGFVDPTAEQVPAVSALAAAPPTTGIGSEAPISPLPLAQAGGVATGAQVLVSERGRLASLLQTERDTLTRLQASLASLQSQGVPVVRTAAVQAAIDQKQRQISGLETRLAQVEIDIQQANQAEIRPNSNVAPQTGAKEY